MRDCELWVLEFFKRERERERVAALFWTISPITKVIISKKIGHLSAIHSFQFFFFFFDNHNGRGEILAWFLKSKTARESEKLNWFLDFTGQV